MFSEVELLDLMVVLFLIFSGISVPFSVAAAPIYIPMHSASEASRGLSMSRAVGWVSSFLRAWVRFPVCVSGRLHSASSEDMD